MRTCQIFSKRLHTVTLTTLFTYAGVSYDIMKLQTCSSFHSSAIATSRFLLLSKSLVTLKLLHLDYFLEVCYSDTFESAITQQNCRPVAHSVAEQ